MSRHDRIRATLLSAHSWFLCAIAALAAIAWEVLWYAPPWWAR